MVKSALVAGTAAALLCAAPASAATRLVDDDGQNCPAAAFTTIQSAIDAAVPGDTVRVCDGIYKEQVVVPASKPRLRIRSDNGGAIIQPPETGLIPQADPGFGYGDSLALLTVDAERTTISRMAVSGTITAVDQSAACDASDVDELRAAGIALRAPRVLLEDSVVPGVSFICPTTRPAGGVAVYPPDGIVLDGNSIFGAPIGIWSLGGRGTALRNFIQDTSTAFAAFEGGSMTLRSNDIRENIAGVVTRFSGIRAIGNRVGENGIAFDFSDGSSGEVRNNFLDGNRDGIAIQGIFQAGIETDLTIRGNRIRDTIDDGIAIFFGPRSGGNVIRDNVVLNSGGFDCYDETSGDGTAGTGDLWVNNVGAKDFPNVCRAP